MLAADRYSLAKLWGTFALSQRLISGKLVPVQKRSAGRVKAPRTPKRKKCDKNQLPVSHSLQCVVSGCPGPPSTL